MAVPLFFIIILKLIYYIVFNHVHFVINRNLSVSLNLTLVKNEKVERYIRIKTHCLKDLD